MFDFDFSKLEEQTKEAEKVTEKRHNDIMDALVKIGDELEVLNEHIKVMIYG